MTQALDEAGIHIAKTVVIAGMDSIRVHICTHIHIYTLSPTHARKQACTLAYARTRTHALTRTHAQTCANGLAYTNVHTCTTLQEFYAWSLVTATSMWRFVSLTPMRLLVSVTCVWLLVSQ